MGTDERELIGMFLEPFPHPIDVVNTEVARENK